MSETIQLTNVRLSFPKLIEATNNKDYPNAPKKFSADFIFAPNHPDYKKVMEHVMGDASEKWKEHAGAVIKMIHGDRRLRCYGDGSEKVNKTTMQPYEGYENGATYITASCSEDRPPIMVDMSGEPIDNSNTMARNVEARRMYGGCYVNAAIKLWTQDNQYGRAIRCELVAVQFAKDSTSFGEAAPDVSGMFGAVQLPLPSFNEQPSAPKMPWE